MDGSDNPAELILDRLREKGWHKGSYGGKAGPNCIAGAAFMTKTHRAIYPLLDPVLKDQYRERFNKGGMGGVANFNDHPDTTFADVERVLEKAAIKWEEERVLRHD